MDKMVTAMARERVLAISARLKVLKNELDATMVEMHSLMLQLSPLDTARLAELRRGEDKA